MDQADAVQVDMPKIFKALSDPTRYRILQLLLEQHHCSRSLAQTLGISEPAVSQHMAVLKDCGLVNGVRRCRHVHYVVDGRVLAAAADRMRSWALESREACDCYGFNRCAFCARRDVASEAPASGPANEEVGANGTPAALKGRDTMRVAVPSDTDQGLASTRSGHFGHSAYFTIVTVEDGEVKKTEVYKNVDHDTNGCGGVIQYALSLGIDAIIVRGMGRPPFMAFTKNGASVFVDAMAPTVGDVIDRFIKGDLRMMTIDQACVH